MSAVLPNLLLFCLAGTVAVYIYSTPQQSDVKEPARPRRIPISRHSTKGSMNSTSIDRGSPLDIFQLSENEPFVSGDFFRAISDHVLNTTATFRRFSNKLILNPGDIIFLKTDFQSNFAKLLPRIKVPFILITHDSDYSAPGDVRQILSNPNVIRWFAQNKDYDHDRLTGIPIGLANAKWTHGNQKLVVEVQKEIIPFANRTIDVLVNFGNTNPDRKDVWKQFCSGASTLNVTCKEKVSSQEEYLRLVANTRFVVSPLGNGIDCHRTWESIALGAIPIVLNSTIREVYEGERVLIVDKFQQVTPQLLEEAVNRIGPIQKTPDTSRLYRKYWLRELKKVREEY